MQSQHRLDLNEPGLNSISAETFGLQLLDPKIIEHPTPYWFLFKLIYLKVFAAHLEPLLKNLTLFHKFTRSKSSNLGTFEV